MDISLDNNAADAFTLELPANEATGSRVLKLSAVVGLSGLLHTEPGLVRLREARAGSGQIEDLRWPIGGGAISSRRPIALSELAVTADFPGSANEARLSGTASAAELSATALDLVLSSLQISTGAVLSGVEVEAGDGDVATRAKSVRCEGLTLQLGELLIRGAVTATGLRVEHGEGQLTVAASSAEALELSLVHPSAEISAAGIELPQGIAFKGNQLRIGELHVGALRAVIPLGRRAPDDETPAGPAVSLTDDVICLGDRKIFDLRDLDRVGGNAEIGVLVRAQLPVVGGYKLDRTFRIPIKDGSLDFVDVERQLGTLEDAFIDFAVRDNELIIKRDIPLLPTKGKKLISWPLSNVEEVLARTRLVSLRTLSRFQLVKAKESDSRASITAVKIDLPALVLTLPPLSGRAAEDRSKDASDAELQILSFEPLSMAGGLRYEADGGARELDASLRASALGLRLERLPIGDSLLGATSISCGELSVEVAEWDGFRPRALAVEIKDVAVTGLTLRSALAPPRAPTAN